jgi:hypothetical protein
MDGAWIGNTFPSYIRIPSTTWVISYLIDLGFTLIYIINDDQLFYFYFFNVFI